MGIYLEQLMQTLQTKCDNITVSNMGILFILSTPALEQL